MFVKPSGALETSRKTATSAISCSAGSKVKSAEWPNEDAPLPQRDKAWETWQTLTLTPNPALSPTHRAAAEEDFGLKSGKQVLKVRRAMLPCTLDHLRLPNGRWEGKPFLVVPGGK